MLDDADVAELVCTTTVEFHATKSHLWHGAFELASHGLDACSGYIVILVEYIVLHVERVKTNRATLRSLSDRVFGLPLKINTTQAKMGLKSRATYLIFVRRQRQQFGTCMCCTTKMIKTRQGVVTSGRVVCGLRQRIPQ